jgi:hypothetical protein
MPAASLSAAPSEAGLRPAPPSWRRWIGYAGGAALGAVLLFAAYAKAIDPVAFSQQIRDQGLALFGSPFAWAVGALALEVGLGVALLLNLRRRGVLVAATLLVALFVFLTGRTYWRSANGLLSAEEAARCGCFGSLVERTPAEAFWQDLLLLVPALALAWTGRPAPAAAAGRGEGRRRAKAGLAALSAVGAGAFAWAAPGLPLDDLATRLAPGTAISELCAGQGDDRICLDSLVPGLAEGRHWVVLADVRAADFPALAAALNRYVGRGAEPGVSVLADLTQEEQMELFWRVAPAFELHETPAALLRPLYRTLPRTFFVEDGRVTRTQTGLPAELASAADLQQGKTDDRQP